MTVVLVVDPLDGARAAEALRSVRAQTRPPGQVLICPVGDADPPPPGADRRVAAVEAAPTWQRAVEIGAAAADQRYILFLHGSDRLLPDALESLCSAARSSSADVATGVLDQVGQPDRWLARSQAEAHAAPGTFTPSELPALAGDLALGNHLFRTEFWRSCEPELADTDSWIEAAPVAAMLRRAGSVVAIGAVVSVHAPDHGRRPYGAMPSALPELSDWRRRVTAVESLLAGCPLVDGWRRHVAGAGLPRFLADAERATDAQWAVLVELAREVRADLPPDLRPDAASLLWLAAEDRRSDVEALAEELFDLGPDLRAHLEGDELVAEWRSVEVPVAVRRLPVAQTPLLAEVRRVGNAASDALVADLFVRVPHLDLATTSHRITVGSAEVVATPDVTANRWAQDRFASAAEGAVRVELPGPGPVEVRLEAGGLVRSRTVVVPPPAYAHDRAAALVDDVRLEGDTLVLCGRALATLRLSGPHGLCVTQMPGREARLPLARDRFGTRVGLRTAPYRLVAPGGVGFTAGLRARLPLELLGRDHRVQVVSSPHGPTLLVGPPFDDDEIGAYAQQRLREEYAGWASGGAPVAAGTCYFESFAGKTATDSPAAILAELRRRRPDATYLWGVVDAGETVPDGVRPVVLRSREWYRTLATAQLVVTNTELEEWFLPRPEQVVVQTFHGYPSKSMGEAQWRAWDLPPSRLRAMRRRSVETWDLIVTPTPEMTRHYREQYGYDGPVAEHGYPRDDALTGPDAAARRHRIRDLLGIGERQTVVLHAPTWRDDLALRPRAAAAADHLDVEAAARALGGGHVLLLRGHRFHTPRADLSRPGAARILDVTDHPEINDLILAADVAVLDYSSLRFDFALTGRPMVFLVPDLADYERVRGFLHPFAETAPGPLVRDTAAVVEQVRDVAALTRRWAGHIAEFNARWNPYQDGKASVRVVDQILEILELPRRG